MSTLAAFRVRNAFQTSVKGTVLSPWADAIVMPNVHPLLTFYDDYYFLPSDLGPVHDHPDFVHGTIANHFQYAANDTMTIPLTRKYGRVRKVDFKPALDLVHRITRTETHQRIDFTLVATLFENERHRNRTLLDASLQLRDGLVQVDHLTLLGVSLTSKIPRSTIQHNIDQLDQYVEDMFEAFTSVNPDIEYPKPPRYAPAP